MARTPNQISSPLRKKLLHYCNAFFRQNSRSEFHSMIYSGMVQNLKARPHSAAFLFCASVN